MPLYLSIWIGYTYDCEEGSHEDELTLNKQIKGVYCTMLELKKGAKVILKGFTGIKLGLFTVDEVSKKTVTIHKANGDEMIFDRKTAKQLNVEEGKEKYASSIMEDDGSYVPASTAGAKKKKAAKAADKKSAKKSKPVEDEDEDEDDEDEDEPAPAKKSTKGKSKPAPAAKGKKKSKPEPDEDEDEDDDFEEDDED